MLTRRSLLRSGTGLGLSVLAVSALGACGADDETAPASGQEAGSTAADAADFPRTVEHELGSTEVPAAPQRVVCATDGGELCSLLALGVTPVGFGQRNDPLSPWLRDLADGIDTYDLSSGETSYERLVAWTPDLLLVQNGFATDDTMPRYTDIAPTVATSFVDWRDNLRQVGAAVGLDEEAEALVTETDAGVAQVAAALGADLGDRVAGLRLNALSVFDDGSVFVFNADSPVGKLAEALGLAPLPPSRNPGEAGDVISREELGLVDGDVLLVLDFGGGPNGNAALAGTDLWQTLGVVRDGTVVQVGPDEANQLYFDTVLTVAPNAALLDGYVRQALA